MIRIPGITGNISCQSRGLDGKDVLLCIRPENININDSSEIKGKIARKVYLGDSIDYRVDLSKDVQLRVVAPSLKDFNEGDTIGLDFETVFGFPVEE